MNERLKEIEESNLKYEKMKKNITIIFAVALVLATLLTYYESSKQMIDVSISTNGSTASLEAHEQTKLDEFIVAENIVIGEDDYIKLNDKYISEEDFDTLKLKNGDVIEIEKVEIATEIDKEPIKFQTKTEDSDKLYVGETKVKQKGQDGVRTNTYEVKTFEGEEVERSVVSSTVTTEPVDKIILKGTKVKANSKPESNNSQSNQTSANEEAPTYDYSDDNNVDNSNDNVSVETPNEPEDKVSTKSTDSTTQAQDSCTIKINGNTVPCSK